jgi:hypothetical protein
MKKYDTFLYSLVAKQGAVIVNWNLDLVTDNSRRLLLKTKLDKNLLKIPANHQQVLFQAAETEASSIRTKIVNTIESTWTCI